MIRLAVVFVAASCATEPGSQLGPELDTATPAAARPGQMVTLEGQRLCDGDCATAGGAIRLGSDAFTVQAQVLAYADTTAVILIPTLARPGRTSIVATVNELSSNALPFEVLP